MASDSIQRIDSITKFESMSNELLMELFEYYDLYSLYYSFGSLNSRIDRITYHCQVCVDFDEVKQAAFIDFVRDVLPKFNPKNIRSLHVSNAHQIAIFAYDKALMYFTHIRSLSFNNVKTKTIEYMLSRIDFSYLEYVSVNKHSNKGYYSSLIIKQFLDSNRFRFLRTYIHSQGAIGQETSARLLEHVSFTGTSDPNNFLNFLHQSPCLKQVEINLNSVREKSHPIDLSPVFYHHTLRYLNLSLSWNVCMKTTVYLFQCVPQLCRLKLYISSVGNPSLADSIFWETVFSKHLMKLKRLSLMSQLYDRTYPIDPIWDVLIDEEKVNEQIKQSHYWSSHQWKATFTSTAVTSHFAHHRATFQVN